MTSRIDTLATHRAFERAGIKPAHAEVIIDAINQADDRFATKKDLAVLRSDLIGEIGVVGGQLRALKSEVAALKWVLGINMAMTFAILVRLFGVPFP